ncbi:MAG: hypothetical protein K0S07_672 [Chlamydiales bacterium]|jgi:hypothetical protein|nr:hypothetical protein [Chlamydiales bacterium]
MEPTVFYTKVSPKSIDIRLKKGMPLCLAGLLLLLLPLFMSSLQQMGSFLFFAGYLLILKGMTPYRQLKNLEQRPHHIEISESSLSYRLGKKEAFTLSLSAVEKFEWKGQEPYGLKIHLKEGFHSKKCAPFLFGSTLFLPYFTKSTAQALSKLLEPNLDDVVHLEQADELALV